MQSKNKQTGDGEQMFVASCFTTSSSIKSRLIDSGCTNHMSYNRELFKELHQTVISRVKIGNGAYIVVEGKVTVAIKGHISLKFIFDVLYVPEINQNLLNVAELLEKRIQCVKFKDFVETPSGCKMQVTRFDNGA
ncbi:Retrovirus-related Pol polyprotein from transposon TNT 1-94 [Gossypium australe]|uniref:Retrovirus-related Pol polyprotein from transposon TNT 1-94 n=1 Tax=Gossypium australe TaxID=47621 RepID=A0A5B6WHJ0_9ROSI|nr:Retrovirus-related Pol polyprotein from transposon TNT 1-94 [Gossypium australe]